MALNFIHGVTGSFKVLIFIQKNNVKTLDLPLKTVLRKDKPE